VGFGPVRTRRGAGKPTVPSNLRVEMGQNRAQRRGQRRGRAVGTGSELKKIRGEEQKGQVEKRAAGGRTKPGKMIKTLGFGGGKGGENIQKAKG